MDSVHHRSVSSHKDARESSSDLSEGAQQCRDTRALWRQAVLQSQRGGGDKWRWKRYASITFVQLNSNGKLAVPPLHLGLILKGREPQPTQTSINSSFLSLISYAQQAMKAMNLRRCRRRCWITVKQGGDQTSHIISIYIWSLRLVVCESGWINPCSHWDPVVPGAGG